MPKFKNMVANATPAATLLLSDKIKDEIQTLNEKPVFITPSSTNARQQHFYTGGVVQTITTDSEASPTPGTTRKNKGSGLTDRRVIRPRGYKTFFMLNSAEHEIISANKYENANNSWHFHIY